MIKGNTDVSKTRVTRIERKYSWVREAQILITLVGGLL